MEYKNHEGDRSKERIRTGPENAENENLMHRSKIEKRSKKKRMTNDGQIGNIHADR